jgi:hypothetical protein
MSFELKKCKIMLNQELRELIECAVPHKCPKEKDASNKCIQCEIGYSFIACEPILLQCGHHVCKECTEKLKKEALKCKICSAELKSKINQMQHVISLLNQSATTEPRTKR